MAYEKYKNAALDTATEEKRADAFRRFDARQEVLLQIQSDLIDFGLTEGFADAQVRTALETLFRTFAPEWSLYLLVGADDLATAITADTTIPWLDTLIGGVSLRQRLVNRLT